LFLQLAGNIVFITNFNGSEICIPDLSDQLKNALIFIHFLLYFYYYVVGYRGLLC
jgi:hypothetical protein